MFFNSKFSKTIYRILMTIDYCYTNKLEVIFDLKALDISEEELGLYLHNLIEEGYIDGITVSKALNQNYFQKYKAHKYCHLTLKGMLFLEENSTIRTIYKNLDELRKWVALIKP